MIKTIRNLICFLTIFPIGTCEGRTCKNCKDCFSDAANSMYLFPIIGALIGLLVGLFAWALLHILSGLIVGMLSLGLLLLITGLHHTDGLLDFSDAVMLPGTRERKIEVMHDQQMGAGGLALGLVVLGTTALSLAELDSRTIIQSIIVCEVSAKLAMTVSAWAGRSAYPGLGKRFIDAVHSRFRNLRLIAALSSSVFIAILLSQFIGILAIAAGLVTALMMVWISNRQFQGLTGDVLGATNELARMFSLVTVLVVSKWV